MRGAENIPGVLMVLAAIFVVPAVVARYLVGGEWRQVGVAYLLWFGFLTLTLILPGKGMWSEKFGWMTILSMFLTIVAVPVLTLVQRVGTWLLTKAG